MGDRMKCDWCESEFSPVKVWQRFCCLQHKDAWHVRERKRAKIEAAEDQREERKANGGMATVTPTAALGSRGLALTSQRWGWRRRRSQ